MTSEEFKKNRIEGREKLLGKILEVFKEYQPVSIHQFGSGATDYKDEFSDLDLWITFKDSEIKTILKNQTKIFKSISPVLLKHRSESWSPIGGSASLIIHDTEFGIFQVDYYISKLSETVIKKDAKVLHGSDLLERGEWKLNKDRKKNTKEYHTFKKDVNLLIISLFINIKGIIRGWGDIDFENNIKLVYKRLQDSYGKKLNQRRIKLSFKFVYSLLEDLYPLANKRQKMAIFKIRNYAEQVETFE